MAKYIWLIERFSLGTVMEAMAYLRLARRRGASPDLALAFVGYATESSRQKTKRGAASYWTAADPKHRYACGRNGGNYRLAGRKLVEAGLWFEYPAAIRFAIETRDRALLEKLARLIPGDPGGLHRKISARFLGLTADAPWMAVADRLIELAEGSS